MSEGQTANLTGTQMANLIGVDPKDFRRFVRKFLRAKGLGEALPGSGSRYSLSASQADDWAERYFADVRTGRRAVIDLDSIDDASSDPDA
jgi:cytochrome P450